MSQATKKDLTDLAETLNRRIAYTGKVIEPDYYLGQSRVVLRDVRSGAEPRPT